jgi:hypothetical protein
MTDKVYAISTQPGIQRDGTVFDKNFYTNGKWVRFQRGRPRKIGGYRAICAVHGYSRGIYVDPENGFNRIFNGYSDGIDIVLLNNAGVFSGISDMQFGGPILTTNTLVGGSLYTNGTYTGVTLTGGLNGGAQATIVVSGGSVTSVTITSGGNYYVVGDTLSAPASSIGGTGSGFSVKVATVDSQFTADALNLWQFDVIFDSQGTGLNTFLAHPGKNVAQIDSTVNSAVLAGPIGGTVMEPLRDISGPTPTGDLIEVSGGVVVLHPYTFVYGNNGLIKNSVAGNPFNWNGPDANETNVSSTKIVKGLPVRGGSNSPSGLFWSVDSLIRVSYAPTTVSVGGVTNTFYWRYDIISSQSSILSSQCVIEYDGIYYWIGVDRFLLYNGVVKEIENTMNQNYFFDNLNYAQRQKVYATKVPRFGEIWWFYPSGNSTECNDAIIYNIRENTWYDAGTALGTRRSAGYFSQVFKFPVNAGSELLPVVNVLTSDITTTGGSTQATIGITNQLRVNLVVTCSAFPAGTMLVAIAPGAPGYYTLTFDTAATTGGVFSATFSNAANEVLLWQHETGTDAVAGVNVDAIDSFFETSDLGWVSGGPSQPSPVGPNFWVRVERVEPDFIQSGEMSVQIVGRPFAQSEDKVSDPYYFDPHTPKVDMREQRREIRLRFRSNTQNGDYQMGKVLLNVTEGDVRPY